MDEDRRAARYAAADEAAQVFRRLLVRAANEGRVNLFFAYAGALARAMNDRAASVEGRHIPNWGYAGLRPGRPRGARRENRRTG